MVDEHALGHLEVAEVRGDGHVAHHRAAHERDAAAVGVGGVQHLLHPVHVTRETGNDDAARRLGHDCLDDRADRTLGGGETGDVGVGGVDHEQVDTGFAEAAERAQVGDAMVQRKLIHLEVASVQHGAGGGLDRYSERIRNRVVHGEEFKIERTDFLVLPFAHGERVRGDAMFLELRLDEREREVGADQRYVGAQPQQVRDGADVILVAMREDDADHVLEPVADRAEVGEDEVDAGLGFLGEEHAAVDDEDLAVDLERGHVATDFAESSDGDDTEGSGGECARRVNR